MQETTDAPSVPDEVLLYIHAYGDARADEDGFIALRMAEAILALRRWARDVQATERARWESAIGAVMPADLKQWHDSPAERPQTAAWCITNARESAEQAWKAADDGTERADDSERYFDDSDDDFDDFVCDRCHGDGADPWCDHLLPCPACQGEQRP